MSAEGYNPSDGFLGKGKVTSQQLIVMNAAFNASELARQRTKTSEYLPSDRIGSIAPLSGRSRAALDIAIGEFVFTYSQGMFRADSPIGSNNSLFQDNKAQVFSSFNGMSLRGINQSQEQFEEMFVPLGMALEAFRVFEPSQPDNGMSVAIGGSSSSIWRSKDTIYPGDYFIVRPPLIDPKKREDEKSKMIFSEENPRDKELAILEVWQPDRIMQFQSSVVDALFDKNSGDRLKISKLRGDEGRVDRIQSVSIALKQLILLSVAAGITTLQDYGALTVHLPDENDPLTQTAFNKHARTHESPLAEARNSKFTFDATNGSLFQTRASATEQADAAKKRKNTLLYFSSIFGVPSNIHGKAHLREREVITESVLGSVLYDSITSQASHRAFSLANIMPSDKVWNPPGFTGIRTFNRRTVEGQVALAYASLYPNINMAFAQLFALSQRGVFGKAITSAKSCGIFDWAA